MTAVFFLLQSSPAIRLPRAHNTAHSRLLDPQSKSELSSLLRSIEHLHSNAPNRPPTVLPQLPIPSPILKPLIHRLANLSHWQYKLPLRLARRFRTRSRVQRIQRSFERRHNRGDFHRQLHERFEERWVLALEGRLNDAGGREYAVTPGVGGFVSLWIDLDERLSVFEYVSF